jgi:hypothetical protein
MSELIRKNASELVELLKSGQVSSVELTQAHLCLLYTSPSPRDES